MGGNFMGIFDDFVWKNVKGCKKASKTYQFSLPAKTIVLVAVLRSQLSPRFSEFLGYFVCNHA